MPSIQWKSFIMGILAYWLWVRFGSAMMSKGR